MRFFRALINLFKIKDLRKRFLIILGFLLIYRFLVHLPLPNIDLEKFKELYSANQFFGLVNIFSGGALSQASIFSLGVGPYITASIIIQLLTLINPKLKRLYYEEGESGRLKANQYARYLTFPIALIQSVGLLNLLSLNNIIFFESTWELIKDVFLMGVGAMIMMWLGELITEQKIGNGISLLVFSGIVASLPQAIFALYLTFSFEKLLIYLPFLIVTLGIIALVVFVNEAEKRIPLVSAKRVMGRRLYGGVNTYFPIKITQAGVIPIIFAIAFLVFPQTLAQFLSIFKIEFLNLVSQELTMIFNNQFIFASFYFILVFAFTYFYTQITFNPEEIAKNFQKSGVFIPGIRPGIETQKYLAKTVSRINFFGGLFLGFLALLPYLTSYLTKTNFLAIGGTSLLILISVAIETIKQIEAEISLHRYEV